MPYPDRRNAWPYDEAPQLNPKLTKVMLRVLGAVLLLALISCLRFF